MHTKWVKFNPTGFNAVKNTNEMNDPNYWHFENVVLQLLSSLEAPAKHDVTFDNFFTNHKLMYRLSDSGYFAIRTVRNDRTKFHLFFTT